MAIDVVPSAFLLPAADIGLYTAGNANTFDVRQRSKIRRAGTFSNAIDSAVGQRNGDECRTAARAITSASPIVGRACVCARESYWRFANRLGWGEVRHSDSGRKIIDIHADLHFSIRTPVAD